MFFSIGGYELALVVAFAIVAAFLFAFNDRRSRWFLVATICVFLAACLTPADLLSTAVTSVAFAATFALGLRMSSAQPTA